MKHVKLFEQFIADSYRGSRRVNEATGADLLRLLDDALSGGVEFQTVYDMKKEDQPPSRQLKAAAKKIDARDDDNVAVIYSSQTDDWDTVLKTVKKWGGKFIEIEDEDGSAIVFPMVESRQLNEAARIGKSAWKAVQKDLSNMGWDLSGDWAEKSFADDNDDEKTLKITVSGDEVSYEVLDDRGKVTDSGSFDGEGLSAGELDGEVWNYVG